MSTDPRAHIRFLIAIGALWLGTFVISLRWHAPEFRPWEILADPYTLVFAADRDLKMQELGDLAAWSWVASLQSPRPVTFTTDAFGLRNPKGLRTPRIVVLGDSYVGGSGLSDDQTVTAHMTRMLGEPVYNFALSTNHVPAMFLADPRFTAQPPEVVIYAPNQRHLVPLSATVPPDARGLVGRAANALQDLEQRVEVSNGLTRSARYLYNGAIYALFGSTDAHTLPDGTRVLTLSLAQQNLTGSLERRHVPELVASIAALSQTVTARGSRLVFAPIPDVGNVYPELYSPAELADVVSPSLIDVVASELRARGVIVVDLANLWRTQRWPYLYRVDDSHWNPHASELTAQVFSSVVRSLRAQALSR